MNRAAFFDAVRVSFGKISVDQVAGFSAILDEWERRRLTNLRWLAYMLATAWHETARTMQPIREYGRGKGRKYGVAINGRVYYGRGFVQLTWDYNYRKAGQKLGVDLVGEPDKALEPAIAAAIMFQGMIEGWFTGKKLGDYLPDGAPEGDPVNARRIINGTDKAAKIAGEYRSFLLALLKADAAAPAVAQATPQPNPNTAPARQPPAPPPPAHAPLPTAKPASSGLFVAIAAALSRLLKRTSP